MERRKVFWLLKKYTSYTAWLARAEAYAGFCDEWLLAMRKADAQDIDDFNRNATKRILDGRIALEKGLACLKRGDRSVWRMNEDKSFAAWGALAQACAAFTFVRQIMDPQEYVFDWMKNKQAVIEKHENLKFWVTGAGAANERKKPSEPAPFNLSNVLATVHPIYGVPLRDSRYLNFPVDLPQVPEAQDVTVVSGARVPFDGIYEPEWEGSQVNADNQFSGESSGCMNYLLAHTSAPLYRITDADPAKSVTWRLIWEDDRYLDGVVPDEEKQYLLPVAEETENRFRCEANQPCPCAGYWFTPAKLDSRRYFSAGEIMPAFESAYGATIWQWDVSQKP